MSIFRRNQVNSSPEKPKFKVKISPKNPWFWLLTLTFVVLTSWLPAMAGTARHYTDLTFPTLPAIKLPDYERYQLKNGMILYLMPDKELPLVSGSAIIRTGDRWEPDQKVGLADLLGTVMRTGGTKQHSPDELNQLLEQKAASVETGIGKTSGSISFSSLSEDLPEVFSLFTEVLREPVFDQDKLDLAKKQTSGQIARRNDDPNDIAGREFEKLIYGDRSPYARTIEYSTLANISRQDLLDFYQQYYHPNNMIVGIVGDFDSTKIRQLIEEKLGDWQPNPDLQLPPLPPVEQVKQGGIFFVDRPDLSQSSIHIGHLGGQLNSPDYAALSTINGLMNGFGGRLFNEVRSRQGLAYSVYGYWSPEFDYPGTFLAAGQSRSEATVPFITAVLGEIKRLRSEPITAAELAYAKESVLNSFVFNFQKPGQTLSRLMRYEYYGYPSDFIFQYQAAVAATTVADVQRVAQKYLQPEKLVTLVVGNGKTIQPPLSSLGSEVTAIDVTIPSPS